MAEGISARLSPGAQGRRFGFTIGTALMVLAGVAYWRGGNRVAETLAVVGGAALVAALVIPVQLVPVERAWLRLALAISRVTTPILMGAVFFLVVTPAGTVRRFFARSPLKHPDGSMSYWVSRAPGARRSDLERQF